MRLSHRTVEEIEAIGAAVPSPPDVPLVEDPATNLPWYVVHTKVRQEQTACENLARQGYGVYFPRVKVLKRRRGRQQAQTEAMFPRYIFLQPGSQAHSIAPVRSTFGVFAIVCFGQEPAVMRPETLRSIREFETRQNAARDEDISPFQCDEQVRVVDGPLAGLEGLITEVSRDRVVVLMQLLGQDTRVNMSHHQLLVAH
ncbi:MAG: transcription termination/antitermination NusG family protein [Gallionella sp.]|nr:transcription termination/antitermination NusG family protein [Gallionella sp.]